MIATLVFLAAAAQANDALGRWQTETRHGVVEIGLCGPSLCAHLLESDGIRANPQLRDIHNAQPDRRERVLKGILMFDGFARKSGGWAGGWIYNPDDGGTYHATITPLDAGHLRVKGCIVWPLCQSQVWTRLR